MISFINTLIAETFIFCTYKQFFISDSRKECSVYRFQGWRWWGYVIYLIIYLQNIHKDLLKDYIVLNSCHKQISDHTVLHV